MVPNKEKHFFYDIDYKNFFKLWEKKNKTINFYYYDAEHSYKNQYENLIIANLENSDCRKGRNQTNYSSLVNWNMDNYITNIENK